ncbi:Phospholipid scramblase 4 [Camelus dromedarius]|uniref:Phospholipid scramblase n=1 Tax=Camelus dromedarius TaxID=9838 RepID=A0A5N4EJK7_CAMDR|nr:Phospholipid scramblase 4 [Camelus dromedarius]
MPDEKHHLGLCSKYRFPDLDPRDAASLLGSRVVYFSFRFLFGFIGILQNVRIYTGERSCTTLMAFSLPDYEKNVAEAQKALDNIHVLQHFEPLEMITHFETNNRYDIKNNLGQMVYFVAEDTDDYTRNAYRTLRPFVLRVTDCLGQEIMTLQRPFRCTCCCFCCPSARQELEVQCPPGVTIGFVAEHWNLCRAVYSIQNEKKEDMMGVRGPCSTYGCGSDSVFEVKSLDGVSSIGSITRKWNGMLSTMSDADHFEIHFPLDLDVKMKAMIFGACFLIDFMYFESSPPQRSSPHHD